MIEFTNAREIVRSIAEHEVLFAFNDDDGAYTFNDWWLVEGEAAFQNWAKENQ